MQLAFLTKTEGLDNMYRIQRKSGYYSYNKYIMYVYMHVSILDMLFIIRNESTCMPHKWITRGQAKFDAYYIC